MAGNNQLRPNTFQTPNLLVDRLMPLLEDSELRVVNFATRHIYGWPDTNAAGRARLSVTSFERGHRGSTGCGLGREAIVVALKSLAGFGVMKKDGTPTRKGQLWGIADHQDEIDWDGLERRAQDQKRRARRRTAQARGVPRLSKSVCPTDQSSGLSDRPAIGLSDRPAIGLSDRPAIGLSNRLIETHIETQSSKPISETQDPTTESVPPAGEDDPPPGDVVVDEVEDREIWEMIRTELSALCLTPVMDQALRALGPEAALAVAMAADQPGVKSPGGLAVSLINDPANIPLALVEKAGRVIERRLELAHPAPLPTFEERRAAHEQLKAEARAITKKRLEEDPMLFSSYSEPPERDDPPVESDEGSAVQEQRSAPVVLDEMAQWRAWWSSLRDEFEIPRTAVPHQVIDEVLCVYCTSRNGEFERLRGRLDEITARLTALAGKSIRVELENIQAMREGVAR